LGFRIDHAAIFRERASNARRSAGVRKKHQQAKQGAIIA
jgi:hypothetical protein